MTREPTKSWTKKDFKLDWFSGTGAGGQHRNKHQNCLRLTELSSGITVTAQNSRSRKDNLREALNQIAPLLVEDYYGKTYKERAPAEEEVRKYHTVDNYVKDIASGDTQPWDSFDLDQALIKRKGALL